MLETLIKLYVMAMANDVRSPTPHMFGPPGCGKSYAAEQLAEMLGVNLHIINVARMSPLETEGMQMPVEENTRIHMIPAAYWGRLKEGDIVLFDEFLRGFPEVYNGLLDIFTSRRAGAFVLPKVFIIAASNSIVTYDPALEDRLMHLPVPDPRKRKAVKKHLAQLIVDQLGLLPSMVDSLEMQSLLDTEVLPMFEVLDTLKTRSSAPSRSKGSSVRNLIGQAELRHVQSAPLKELLKFNNIRAMSEDKPQFVLLESGTASKVDVYYEEKALSIQGNPKLSETQAKNLELNLQLIEMERIRNQKEGSEVDVDVDDDDLFS